MPDYNVSLAELVIPASDLSQHIRWVLLLRQMQKSVRCDVTLELGSQL